MTFSIAIRTIARKEDYCARTLARLSEIGALSDPCVLGLHVSNGFGISPNRNGCRALKMAAADGADWVLFSEDDVDFIGDLIGSLERWMSLHAVPWVKAYPLSCFYSDAVAARLAEGHWLMPIEKFYGSQAFLMRSTDAAAYADWLVGLNKSFERDVSFDLHLAQWHVETVPTTRHLITPAPCFVDHIGEFSSMGPPGSWERVGRVVGFAGRDWSYRG